jgi:hypothetical protein
MTASYIKGRLSVIYRLVIVIRIYNVMPNPSSSPIIKTLDATRLETLTKVP